jgi:hypothetical protein
MRGRNRSTWGSRPEADSGRRHRLRALPGLGARPTHDPRHRTLVHAYLPASQPPSTPNRCRPSHLTGFPTWEYHGNSAPPGALNRRWIHPGAGTGCPEAGNLTRPFPCSLLSARPRRSPALPLQPRRGHAADLQHGLPDHGLHQPGKFPAHRRKRRGRVRAAPGPDPPGSSRSCVEGRYDTGSSRTPLEHASRTHAIWQC